MLNLHRNKRDNTLNLKAPEGLDIRNKLAIQGMEPASNVSSQEFQQMNLKEALILDKLVTTSGAKVD